MGSNHSNKKLLDYKHQKRSTEGGVAWRKVRSRLPHRERKLYRQAQERALHAALCNDDTTSDAGDRVRAVRRSSFVELHSRREIPLGMRVRYVVRRIWLRAGKKKGRSVLFPRLVLAKWLEPRVRKD